MYVTYCCHFVSVFSFIGYLGADVLNQLEQWHVGLLLDVAGHMIHKGEGVSGECGEEGGKGRGSHHASILREHQQGGKELAKHLIVT